MFLAFAFAIAAATAAPAPSPSNAASPEEAATTSPFPTPAPVDGLSVADVLAKSRLARGADAKVPHEIVVWQTRSQGLGGTRRRVSLGANWRETFQRGTFVTASGAFEGHGWRQNENGLVLVRQSPPDTDARTVSQKLERVRSPIDAFVIESVSAAGTKTRDFYDAKTFLLVRRERDSRGVLSYVIYEDFVTDSAGRTFAHHVFGGDQRPNNDFDAKLITEDLISPVSAAEVALPTKTRTLVEFPSGRSTVRLPARIVNGAIVVRAQIGDQGVDLLLDSGASSIVLDARTLAGLGIDSEGAGTTTVAGNVSISRARVPSIVVGDLVLRDIVVDVLPYTQNVESQTKVAGLLGFDFFEGAVITIDYKRGVVDATEPAAFTPAAGASEEAVRTEAAVPEVSLQIGQSKGDHFVIDTGAQRATIVLFSHFVRVNENRVDSAAKRGEGDPLRSRMIGGLVSGVRVLLPSVIIGPWELTGLHAILDRSPPAFDAEDGLIGSDFLDGFLLSIDESHSRVFLQPAAQADTPASK